MNKPRTGYQRHGALGGAAGAAVAIPNIVIKPVVGTLASLTWLGRGIYAEMRHTCTHRNSKPDRSLSVLTPSGHRRSSSGSSVSTPDSSPEERASLESGLRTEICQEILTEFERIKNERHAKSSLSTSEDENKKSTKSKQKLQRQRSQSAVRQ